MARIEVFAPGTSVKVSYTYPDPRKDRKVKTLFRQEIFGEVEGFRVGDNTIYYKLLVPKTPGVEGLTSMEVDAKYVLEVT